MWREPGRWPGWGDQQPGARAQRDRQVAAAVAAARRTADGAGRLRGLRSCPADAGGAAAPGAGLGCPGWAGGRPMLACGMRRAAGRGDLGRLVREENEHWATVRDRVRWDTLGRGGYLPGQGAAGPVAVGASERAAAGARAGGGAAYRRGNRLLLMVHQDLMRDDPSFAVTCVARTLAMSRGWRLQVALAPRWLWYGGPVVVGWTVGSGGRGDAGSWWGRGCR
jgi:hypothetical protein